MYRVLDEVQKAAMSIMQWKDYLSRGLDFADAKDEEGRQLGRLAVESVVDEQHFRSRKLSEVLVDSILFGTTNDQSHYRDYFFMHELNETAHSQQDKQEFFGFQNQNTAWHANWLYEEICRLEKNGLDPSTRWYLAQPARVQKQWTTKGVPLSSFRQRYKRILSVAIPSELTVIGISYQRAYGMSKDVHFTPHDISSDFSVDEILIGTTKVGLLILSVMLRCQQLMGCVPDGVNKRYREMHDNNAYPEELMYSLKSRPAEPGDIVLVHGDLAEVINVTTSKYGYPAYHVNYLGKAPLPEVNEDWFTGFEVKLVTRRAFIEQTAEGAARVIQEEMGNQQDFKLPEKDQLFEYAKEGVNRLHHYLQGRRSALREAESKNPDSLPEKKTAGSQQGAPADTHEPRDEGRDAVEK
jgi:hypothetical protein